MTSPTVEVPAKATIVAKSDLSPTTLLLRFSVDERNFAWLPGQYIALSPLAAPRLHSYYSVASAPDPDAPGSFELAVSRNADAELLAELEPGRTLLASPARGTFVWRPHDGDTLLVGMGTGVAPLRAMTQAALREAQGRVVLLVGARTEEYLLFRREFEHLSEPFRYEPTLSRAGALWSGRRGHVQDHFADVLGAVKEPWIYVCGTKPMVESSLSRLTELGVPPARIASEAHGD